MYKLILTLLLLGSSAFAEIGYVYDTSKPVVFENAGGNFWIVKYQLPIYMSSFHEVDASELWRYTWGEFLFDTNSLSWRSNGPLANTSSNWPTYSMALAGGSSDPVYMVVTNGIVTNGFYRYGGDDRILHTTSDTSYNLAGFTTGVTISCWIRPTDVSSTFFMLSKFDFGDYEWQLFMISAGPSLQIFKNPASNDDFLQTYPGLTCTFITNQWIHLLMTATNPNTVAWSWYTNGVYIPGTGGTSGVWNVGETNKTGNGKFAIGGRALDQNYAWRGDIDNVEILNRYTPSNLAYKAYNDTKQGH